MVAKAPADFTHYDAGLTAFWRRWTLDVRYVGTTITRQQCAAFWMGTPKACTPTIKASVTYTIDNLFR
jgi:hypothetical protein